MYSASNVHFFHSFSRLLFLREGRRASSRRRTRDASQSTAISDISAGSVPRRVQARSEMYSLHLVLGRPIGPFPVGIASRTCLAKLSRGIFDRWPNQRSWDLWIRRSGLTFSGLRIAHLHTLSRSVIPWMPKRGHCLQGCNVGVAKSRRFLAEVGVGSLRTLGVGVRFFPTLTV